jgi:hypothetical protein
MMRILPHSAAAVDVEGLAGDLGGLVAGEVEGAVGGIGRSLEAAQWHVRRALPASQSACFASPKEGIEAIYREQTERPILMYDQRADVPTEVEESKY